MAERARYIYGRRARQRGTAWRSATRKSCLIRPARFFLADLRWLTRSSLTLTLTGAVSPGGASSHVGFASYPPKLAGRASHRACTVTRGKNDGMEPAARLDGIADVRVELPRNELHHPRARLRPDGFALRRRVALAQLVKARRGLPDALVPVGVVLDLDGVTLWCERVAELLERVESRLAAGLLDRLALVLPVPDGRRRCGRRRRRCADRAGKGKLLAGHGAVRVPQLLQASVAVALAALDGRPPLVAALAVEGRPSASALRSTSSWQPVISRSRGTRRAQRQWPDRRCRRLRPWGQSTRTPRRPRAAPPAASSQKAAA
eukprot:scaffold104907_cov48-Phaeocystis_antarctica.AAC.2